MSIRVIFRDFLLSDVIQVSGSRAGSIPLSFILERVSGDWYEVFKWSVEFTMESGL